MTLEQLLAWSKDDTASSPAKYAVLDMLGEALPCGLPTPGVSRAPDKEAMVDIDPVGDGPDDVHAGTDHWVPVGEARAWAAAILHACDRAEEV